MNFQGILTPVSAQVTELTSRAAGPIADLDFWAQSLLFVEASILAYLDMPDVTKWGTLMGFTRITQRVIPNDLAVTILSNETDIVVSFRGTQNLANIQENFDCDLTPDGTLHGKAHDGFLKSFDRIWPTVLPVLDSKKKVWTTGHSLGGAMAAIACIRANHRAGPNLDGLFTFGQPRIGNFAYVGGVRTDTYRFVNNRDIIPSLPGKFMGFSHFGKEFFIDHKGNIAPRSLLSTCTRMSVGLLGLIPLVWDDHNIINYRKAILRLNQESAHAQR